MVITEKLATRRNYRLGSTITLMIGDRVLPFVVRGILKNEGPAKVVDGNFILMDIAAAQLAFDRIGRVDHIDVLLPEGRDLYKDLDAISARLPAGLSAQRPQRRGEQVETMLAAFHTNLTALSWIALIVGLFLVYNTITISVVARRQEIGTLRALGLTRNKVLMLFLGREAGSAATAGARSASRSRAAADAAVTRRRGRRARDRGGAPPPEMKSAADLHRDGALPLIAAAGGGGEEAVPPTAAMRGHDNSR